MIPFRQWQGQGPLNVTYGDWEYFSTNAPSGLTGRIGGDYPAIFNRDAYYDQTGHYTVFGQPIRLNIRRRWEEVQVGHGRVRITVSRGRQEIRWNPGGVQSGYYDIWNTRR